MFVQKEMWYDCKITVYEEEEFKIFWQLDVCFVYFDWKNSMKLEK